MVRMGGDDGPVIQINVTRDELQVLVYAVAAFHDLTNRAPLIAQQVSRSDAMKGRRAAARFHERIKSLGEAYGMDMP